MGTWARVLGIAVVVLAGCSEGKRSQVVAISGPLCTGALAPGETNHCLKAPTCSLLADASHSGWDRCDEFVTNTYIDTSGNLGAVQWKAFWIRPPDRSPEQLAGRVPLLFAHGMTMNEGFSLNVVAGGKLAAITGRPVLLTAELVPAVGADGYGVGAITSNAVGFVGSGNFWGDIWVDDMMVTGPNTTNFTWEGATLLYPQCPMLSHYEYGSGGWHEVLRRMLPNYTTGYGDASTGGVPKLVCARFKQIRSGVVARGTGGWSLQAARAKLIQFGKVAVTTQFDAIGHSAGPLYLAAALANHNGRLPLSGVANFANFSSAIRSVISLAGANFGALDTGEADMEAQSSSNNAPAARKNFIQTWNYTGSPVNRPRWFAVAQASCARKDPSKGYPGPMSWNPFYTPPIGHVGSFPDDMISNYLFGEVRSLKHLGWFLGGRNWIGDGVIPTRGQYSPWFNSVGFQADVQGRPGKYFKRLVYNCGNQKTVASYATGSTVTTQSVPLPGHPAATANYLGEPGVFGWKGSHKWLILSAEGWSEWLPVLESACLMAGASCQYETPCYTGPAGTSGVGLCHGGLHYASEPAEVCHGEQLPAEEVCDAVDNDCDGDVDEVGTAVRYRDADHDGFGTSTAQSAYGCAGITYPGWASNPDDCLDTDARVYPQPPLDYTAFPTVNHGWDFNCDGEPEPHCGDQLCQSEYELYSCEEDCGPPPDVCGDDICTAAEAQEGCADCAACLGGDSPVSSVTLCPPSLIMARQAAASCGDARCEGDESKTCPEDCASAKCGDELCSGDESPERCPEDCGEPARCGNRLCDGDETAETCGEDCKQPAGSCGDRVCDGEEEWKACPEDCQARCGDGVCASQEEVEACPEDCGKPAEGFCGDGTCESWEAEWSKWLGAPECPADCAKPPLGECEDGVCDEDESYYNCPQDCRERGDNPYADAIERAIAAAYE